MASTAITDMYDPDIWVEDELREREKASRLVQSGIITQSQRVNSEINAGGQLITIPSVNPITGSSERLNNGTTMTPVVQDSQITLAPHLRCGKTWSWDDVTDWVKPGEELATAAVRQLGGWEAEDDQEILLNVLDGIFATALSGTHVHSVAAAASATELMTAAQKIGDRRTQITAMICHSHVARTLEQADLVTAMRDSESNTNFNLFAGRFQIIEDDDCPVIAGSPLTYVSYLFGAGSVVYARKTNIPTNEQIELHRNSLGSADMLSARRSIVMSPAGVSYTGATMNPDNAELATGANWTKVYPDKLIKIVKMVTQ